MLVRAKSEPTELEALRAEMDRIDQGLVELIASRRDLALRIGEVKRRTGLSQVDPEREAAVVRRSAEIARERGLHTEHVRDVFWRLIAISHGAVSEPAASVRPGPRMVRPAAAGAAPTRREAIGPRSSGERR